MEFVNGFTQFYTQILDITFYIVYFLVSAGLVIHIAPKEIKKNDILRLVLMFLGTYASCVLLSSIMFGFASYLPFQSAFRAIVFASSVPLIIIAFSLIFNKGHKLHKFIKIETLVSVAIICDVISKNLGFLFSTGPNEFNIWLSLTRAAPFILFIVLCTLMHFINIDHYRNLFKPSVAIITGLCAIIITVSAQEHLIDKTDNDFNILLSLVDLLLVLLLGFTYYSMYKNIQHRHSMTNLEVQKTLAEAEKMSMMVDQVNREELEKIRHDIKNQYSYLEILIKEGKIDEAIKYIDELREQKNKVLYSFSCSNRVINAIVNLELTKAKMNNVPIDVKAIVPPQLPFKEIDLVSLITNMMDNAIENFNGDEKHPITVRILKQNDFVRFIVSNPIDTESVTLGNITTTRKAGRGHGYGTKIIKNIAKTYDGYADFNVEGNLFICDAVLNLGVKE